MKTIIALLTITALWIAALEAYFNRQAAIDWIRVPGPFQIAALTGFGICIGCLGIWIYRAKGRAHWNN